MFISVITFWFCCGGTRMQAEALVPQPAYGYHHNVTPTTTYLLSYFMGCIALVRCVLVLRCGLAVVVWYP